MPGSWPPQELPYLTQNNCTVRSLQSYCYNCIAWAAGDNTRWWWPVPRRGINYWPKGIQREETLDAFIAAFETLGYASCADGSLQDGVEKVALFAKKVGTAVVPTHAALQLESGGWTSKIGSFEDVHHATADAVRGPVYGEIVQFLSRQRNRPPGD